VAPGGAAPYRVGEHTRDVLRDVLGYADDRIADLLTRGVIEAAP
jgi:crotonobetainyl-CoA:carnitine CoA-transferase CaiB-like acyl-CoA transferase